MLLLSHVGGYILFTYGVNFRYRWTRALAHLLVHCVLQCKYSNSQKTLLCNVRARVSRKSDAGTMKTVHIWIYHTWKCDHKMVGTSRSDAHISHSLRDLMAIDDSTIRHRRFAVFAHALKEKTKNPQHTRKHPVPGRILIGIHLPFADVVVCCCCLNADYVIEIWNADSDETISKPKE